MKLAKTSGALGLLAVAVTASPFAVAADAGWYGGLNVGQSRSSIDDARITQGLLAGPFATVSIADDDNDIGFKIFGGYQFSRHFALEGGYFNLGKFGFTAVTTPAGTLNGTIKLQGFNLDLVGILPVTEKFSLFGRAGVNYAEARDSFAGTGLVRVLNPNPSQSDTNYKFGLGMQYAFTPSLAMRLEAERYRINDAIGNKGDVDLVSVGLLYRFGAKTPAPAPRAAAPEPAARQSVAIAPPPQQVAVTPPPPKPRIPMKVMISTDSLFDFDKSTVRPEGKQHLDKLAADLKGVDYELITVTGYTDRIGTPDYNMDLSTRRAEAVKAHLVNVEGIPASKITATGKGEAEPVTKPEDCKGNTATRELIACLQPDRRVEVEVRGTK